jgi:hypothetical protein
MFFLVDGDGGLLGFAKCEVCRLHGLNDSLHIRAKVSHKVRNQAILDGLPVCHVKEG